MRILLIVPPERFDFYSYLVHAKGVEWILLWYEKPGLMQENPSDLPLTFKEIHYWTEFQTPFDLLKKLKPDRIIFFEIIDLRQIALILSARRKKISTFYLEHGAAGDMETAIERWKEITFAKHKLPYFFARIKSSFLDIIKSKIFYYSVLEGFDSIKSYFKYFLLPFKMLGGAPNKILSKNIFRERLPTKSILFNEANFEEFVTYTGIDRSHAILPGVPFFDKYHLDVSIEGNHIVYIDHPYFEEGINNWNEAHHDKVARCLFEFAEKYKTKLYIKLHPRSNCTLWEKYNFNPNYLTVIQFGDFTRLYLESKLILGFSSSLITGFLCAKKNIVLLGWHPQPSIFGADFSTTGLCHVSYSPDDVFIKYKYWEAHNLVEENHQAYQDFLNRYNCPFDGKATERVIEAITA